MITGIAEAIHQLSQGMTLKAGTIIAMGTPSGVGMAFDPPKYLKARRRGPLRDRRHRLPGEPRPVKSVRQRHRLQNTAATVWAAERLKEGV